MQMFEDMVKLGKLLDVQGIGYRLAGFGFVGDADSEKHD